MPGVPLFNSHGERIDIFVKKLQQTDRLDDWLVLPVDVQGNFIPGEGVCQPQSGLLELDVFEFVMLQKFEEVLPDASDELID